MNTEREAIENEQAAYKAYVEWKQGKSDEVIFPVDGFKAGWQAALANKPEASELDKENICYVECGACGSVTAGSNEIRITNHAAALQKRIEELEATGTNARNEALEQAASICDELSPHPDPHYDVNRAAAKIRALKAGDVQAPKEGIIQKLQALSDEKERQRQAEQNPHMERILLGMREGYDHAIRILSAAPTDTEGK